MRGEEKGKRKEKKGRVEGESNGNKERGEGRRVRGEDDGKEEIERKEGMRRD